MFHCSVIKDHFLHCRLSQTALLLYHVVSCLSRTFFNVLKLFLFLPCSNSVILSHPTGCCQELFSFLFDSKNVNIKFDIFSCFYRFAILHNTQPVLLYIFTFRQRNSKAATAASLSRSLFPFLCKLLYLFLE